MKRASSFIRYPMALALLSALSCSLVVDASDIDADCPDGERWCDGACVRTDDPQWGCAELDCRPCLLANATPQCNLQGKCEVKQCLHGFTTRSEEEGCVNAFVEASPLIGE